MVKLIINKTRKYGDDNNCGGDDENDANKDNNGNQRPWLCSFDLVWVCWL